MLNFFTFFIKVMSFCRFDMISNGVKFSIKVPRSVHVLTIFSCHRWVFKNALNCTICMILIFWCLERTEPHHVHHFLLLGVTLLILFLLILWLLLFGLLFLILTLFTLFEKLWLLITWSLPCLFQLIFILLTFLCLYFNGFLFIF